MKGVCLKLQSVTFFGYKWSEIYFFAIITSVNIKKLSRLVSYMACEDPAGGGSFTAFSYSSWNNYIYHCDSGL